MLAPHPNMAKLSSSRSALDDIAAYIVSRREFGTKPTCKRHRNWVGDRCVVVLQLVDRRGDRPHAHRLSRERSHQSCGSRSSLGASRRRENKRHSIVDLGHQFVEHRCDNRESTNPFAGGRVFPVFLQPAEAKRTAVLHGNRVELLSFLALNQMSLTKVSPLLHSSSHSWSVLFPCLDPGHEPLQYLVRLNIIPSQIS